ncbi:MAG: DNA mismatch repair protein MutS [Defluviitaleaceae bacterium]|nr:DNA mismatch repair protein MutS [Defluviitaleaceae bacterium]
MPSYTPMMEQYFSIKNQHKDAILLFRLGDFYEMFFDDAIIASKCLDIALTARDCGQAERAAMCGVPVHAVEGYIAKLVAAGHHVAMCDQVEDAKFAKGLVKREVVRVITPGTIIESHLLEEGRHNYITCIHKGPGRYSLATADITTGHFMVTSLPIVDDNKLLDELARLNPAEVLLPEDFPLARVVENVAGQRATKVPPWSFGRSAAFDRLTNHFGTFHLEGFGLSENAPEVPAAGALLSYLSETQKHALSQITSIKIYSQQTHMILDASSRRNLELTSDLKNRSKKGSLLGVLDRTKTAMGARLLRSWVELPLMCADNIRRRLDGVEEWLNSPLPRVEVRDLLSGVHDLERVMGRLSTRYCTARDLSTLRGALTPLPAIGKLLKFMEAAVNKELSQTYDDLADIHSLIDVAIVDAPPAATREGGMIRQGYNQELDKLLDIKENAANYLAEIEAREREATGIKNLKIRNNRVFGYYIEVTQSYLNLVPESYVRKQTLANAERYITAELKDLEDTILTAEEQTSALEYELFEALRREVVEQMARIQFTAMALATIDSLQSLADVADRNQYVKPNINMNNHIEIIEGRHPVVEGMLGHGFVPNDSELDKNAHRLAIITGPNMAGKSTYMRQVALIVLMAQIGSYVPAEKAEIGMVDRIFTRVGASDDLATGQSTFMVEMTEVANILNNATGDSLVLLDEIGRGTSTFDGLAIAWAVLEYIASRIGAKTLFATHYHELTKLEGQVEGVINYCFTAHETEKDGETDIVFLRKLIHGEAGQSYGIHVAKLAGLPSDTLSRANQLLTALNDADISKKADNIAPPPPRVSVAENKLAQVLKSIDTDKLTPMDALITLSQMKELIRE